MSQAAEEIKTLEGAYFTWQRNRLEGAGRLRSIGKEPRAKPWASERPRAAGAEPGCILSKVKAPEHKTVLPAICFTHPQQQERAAQLWFDTDDWKYWASRLHTQIHAMKSRPNNSLGAHLQESLLLPLYHPKGDRNYWAHILAPSILKTEPKWNRFRKSDWTVCATN